MSQQEKFAKLVGLVDSFADTVLALEQHMVHIDQRLETLEELAPIVQNLHLGLLFVMRTIEHRQVSPILGGGSTVQTLEQMFEERREAFRETLRREHELKIAQLQAARASSSSVS